MIFIVHSRVIAFIYYKARSGDGGSVQKMDTCLTTRSANDSDGGKKMGDGGTTPLRT